VTVRGGGTGGEPSPAVNRFRGVQAGDVLQQGSETAPDEKRSEQGYTNPPSAQITQRDRMGLDWAISREDKERLGVGQGGSGKECSSVDFKGTRNA